MLPGPDTIDHEPPVGEPVNDLVWLIHIAALLDVIDGVGNGLTVTVLVAVLVHVFAPVTVTVYVVVLVGLTVLLAPVPKPPLHE